MRNNDGTLVQDRTNVVYLGQSPSLHEICAWGQQHGIQPADEPTRDTLCAIVDQGLLAGATTRHEHEMLRLIWLARLPYLTPERAWPLFSSAVNRGLLATA